MLETVAITVVASCLVSLVNWFFSRPAKTTEQIHSLDRRLIQAEEKLHNMGNRVTKTEEAIEDIRENMARRSDLETALSQLKEWLDRR